MQKKGGVGVVAVMLSAHNIIDLVKIMLPAPVMTRLSQAADNWGDMWVRPRCILAPRFGLFTSFFSFPACSRLSRKTNEIHVPFFLYRVMLNWILYLMVSPRYYLVIPFQNDAVKRACGTFYVFAGQF